MQTELPDAELLRKCTEFYRVNADYREAERVLKAAPGAESQERWKSFEEGLSPLHNALADTIISIPALTHDGTKAKAAVLRLMMEGMISGLGTHASTSYWEPHERLAWSLVNDLATAV